MLVRLTEPYRSRLADVLTGTGVGLGLTPTSAKLGLGSNGAAPRDTMYAPTLDATLSTARAGNHEVKVTVLLPAGQQDVMVDEVGILAGDGTLLLHATFPAQPLVAGATAQFEFTFNPEVYDDNYQG